MIDIASINLESAIGAYLVSNTPMFFLKKLQADGTVGSLAWPERSAELLATLPSSLAEKPTRLAEKVFPFVLLVAIAKTRDLEALRQAASVAAPHHPWYPVIADVLQETSTPFTRGVPMPHTMYRVPTFTPASTNSTATAVKIVTPEIVE